METVPDTMARCAPRPAGPPQVSARSTTRALRRVLAEVFRVEVLEVGFQRVRVERLRGARPRLAGVDGGVLQQGFAGEDRGLEAQRHGDRVGGPGVDLNHLIPAVKVRPAVVRLVLRFRGDALAQAPPGPDDPWFQ